MTQLGYGRYHECELEDGRDYFSIHFDDYCANYGEHITQDVWQQYYSLEFLLQPSTARFWRLPNLRDLPSSCQPIGNLRDKPIGHFTKLPRWADNVIGTSLRQPTLSRDIIIQIAIDTLRDVTLRLREYRPEVPAFSETQTQFWINYMRREMPFAGGPNYFDIFTAQGGYDMYDWERYYSSGRWYATSEVALEPDLDGSAMSEVGWCSMPDGGTAAQAGERGWIPELGSEEEVEFMAAVAAKETEGCSVDELDFSVRSHMLFGVLQLSFAPESQRGRLTEDLQERFILGGRLNETNAAEWIENVLAVMAPYASEVKSFPDSSKERSTLLRRILAENGQVFARGGWKISVRRPVRGFKFDLAVKPKSNR